MAKNKKKSANAPSGTPSVRSTEEPDVTVEEQAEVGEGNGVVEDVKDEVKAVNGDAVVSPVELEKVTEPNPSDGRTEDVEPTVADVQTTVLETTNTAPTDEAIQAFETTAEEPTPAPETVEKSGSDDEDEEEEEEDDSTRITRLEHELETTRAEKEQLGTQYRSLLSKLTTMRQSLGDRLREDAEELDRRESQITQLSADLQAAQESITSLRTELESSAEESTQLSAQVSQLRLAASTQTSDVLSLTRELRELRGEMEMLRVEREQWEAEAERERDRREAMEDDLRAGERQRREDEARRRRAEEEWEREKTRAGNLQEVLADFQNGVLPYMGAGRD